MNKSLFHTIDGHSTPTRQIRTSEARSREPLLLSFRQSMTARSSDRKHHSHHCNLLLTTHRPLSSATIDSTVSYCKPRDGELFLKESVKDDLNKYLIRRIHNDTRRHEQSLTEQKFEIPNQLEVLFETEKERQLPKSYLNSKICEALQSTSHRTTKVIAEPFLLNCREKLRRIIERKKQNEGKYNDLKYRIQDALKINRPIVIFRNHQVYIEGNERLKSMSETMTRTIEHEIGAEGRRYQKRLMSRHKRN